MMEIEDRMKILESQIQILEEHVTTLRIVQATFNVTVLNLDNTLKTLITSVDILNAAMNKGKGSLATVIAAASILSAGISALIAYFSR
jgi:hypothetical protein